MIISVAVITKFEAYLLTEKCVSRHTLAAYKADIGQFVTFVQKLYPDQEHAVEVEDIRLFLQKLSKEQLKTKSVARKISSLKAFFTFAQLHLDWEDIAADIDLPKIEKTLPKYLTEQEIQILLDATEGDSSYLGLRNKAMIYLLYATGMRISELTNVRVVDLHLQQSLLAIRGKGDKERLVPLPEGIVALLQEHLGLLRLHVQEKHEGRLEYLFPVLYAGTIRPITRQALWAIIKVIWKTTGIPKVISPHQLRHSFATHMLKNGVHLRSLQLLLGHEQMATVQMYTHVEKTYARKVYDKKHPRS